MSFVHLVNGFNLVLAVTFCVFCLGALIWIVLTWKGP